MTTSRKKILLTPRFLYACFRSIIWAIPIFLLLWVLDKHVVFGTSVTLSCTAADCSPAIRSFASKESGITLGSDRAKTQSYRVITADPLYFDTALLRPMKRATVTLEYQDPGADRSLQLGVFMPGSFYQYYELGAEHPHLNTIEDSWKLFEEQGLKLYQNPKAGNLLYTSVDDFFSHPPQPEKVAVFNVDAASRLHIPDYVAGAKPLQLQTPLRGSHELLVYLGQKESLDLRLEVQDLNRVVGRDDFSVSVLRGEQVITRSVLRDDGNEKSDNIASKIRELRVKLESPGEGVYHVRLDTNRDDTIIRSITSGQSRVMYNHRLFLGSSDEYRAAGLTDNTPVTVYVQGKNLTLETGHAKSLQTVTVGNRKVKLEKINTPVTIKLPNSVTPIPVTIPLRDITLSSNDAVMGLASEEMFSTAAVDFQDLREVKKLDTIEYVVAQYKEVKHEGAWSIATIDLPTLPAGSTYHFLITGDAALSQANPIRVKKLSIQLQGDRLGLHSAWESLRSLIRTLRKS